MCVVGRGLQRLVTLISVLLNRALVIRGALQSVLEVEEEEGGGGEQVLHHHHHHRRGAKSRCCTVASSAAVTQPASGELAALLPKFLHI